MDESIILFLNQFAGRSRLFDGAVWLMSGNALIKGVPLALLFLYLWHRPAPGSLVRRARLRLLALLPVAVLAIALGRAAAVLLPYRARPLHAADLDLRLPLFIQPTTLDGWSSMPSDHAVLFATLVAGLALTSRWAGLAAAVHALVVIAFARVYLTLHYPSDILVGALIGAAAALLLVPWLATLADRTGLPDLAERWPHYSHPLLFVVLMEIVSMFNNSRALLGAVAGAFG